jgi:ribulose-phosphate 3-epimerase
MAEIIPAVMPRSLSDLEEHASRVLGGAKVVQIDIMDGAFVKNRTWPYIRPDNYFDELVQEERGLPLWEDIDYEIDLMVADALGVAEQWIQAGARRLIFHVESLPSFKAGTDIAPDMEKILSYKNDFTEVGLAIGISTSISVIEPYLSEISCVQCMGIKRIGFQGEPLDPEVFEKIKKIREKAPELPISVDGGVSEDDARSLVRAGATRLVSGSLVFESVNPIDAIRHLKSIAFTPDPVV